MRSALTRVFQSGREIALGKEIFDRLSAGEIWLRKARALDALGTSH
jgi:hypothetical protein